LWRFGSAAGIDHRFGHSERIEKSSVHIFPSSIFLLAKPKQENAGGENMSGLFLMSSADARNDNHGRSNQPPPEFPEMADSSARGL
jgi:hypothetical protein